MTEPHDTGDGPYRTEAEPAEDAVKEAKHELFEAIEHFKNAATLLFERASNDPAVRNATTEAERVLQKVGEQAEPVARQLSEELGKLTRRLTDSLSPRRKPDDQS